MPAGFRNHSDMDLPMCEGIRANHHAQGRRACDPRPPFGGRMVRWGRSAPRPALRWLQWGRPLEGGRLLWVRRVALHILASMGPWPCPVFLDDSDEAKGCPEACPRRSHQEHEGGLPPSTRLRSFGSASKPGRRPARLRPSLALQPVRSRGESARRGSMWAVGGGEDPRTMAEREALAVLRRENRTLRQERDILQKATALFAREGMS